MDTVVVAWKGKGGGVVLLEFKEFLKSNGADADHLLPTTTSVVIGRESCGRTMGHVLELSLHNIKDAPYIVHNNIWLINASLFLPFKELRSLNLSFNLFSAWTDNEDMQIR
ncbi:hypothetical protein ACSBR2_042686 [Camellia fascicularis]